MTKVDLPNLPGKLNGWVGRLSRFDRPARLFIGGGVVRTAVRPLPIPNRQRNHTSREGQNHLAQVEFIER